MSEAKLTAEAQRIVRKLRKAVRDANRELNPLGLRVSTRVRDDVADPRRRRLSPSPAANPRR